MVHRRSPLTPEGRRRLVVLVIDHGWSQRRVAERFQVSSATVWKWVSRHRQGHGFEDRSSRPQHTPRRLPARTERRIIALRFTKRWGPHRIGAHLGVPRSTVGRVLQRYAMPKLDCIDQATGLPVRREAPHRYEASAPGELVHVDVKKLGRIPTAEGGVLMAEALPRTSRLGALLMLNAGLGLHPPVGTAICITRSMTTPGWSIPRSSMMSASTPRPGSGTGPRLSSTALAWR